MGFSFLLLDRHFYGMNRDKETGVRTRIKTAAAGITSSHICLALDIRNNADCTDPFFLQEGEGSLSGGGITNRSGCLSFCGHLSIQFFWRFLSERLKNSHFLSQWEKVLFTGDFVLKNCSGLQLSESGSFCQTKVQRSWKNRHFCFCFFFNLMWNIYEPVY